MKLRVNKKAQAALEFLMTYGWAIMVVMVMVAALAYYGVLNPTKYLPDRCSFGVQLNCEDHVLRVSPEANQGYAEFALLNAMGSKIKIEYSEIEVSGVKINCTTYSDKTYDQSKTEFDDQSRMFFKCYETGAAKNPGFIAEEKVKINVNINYIKDIYSKPLYGEIYGTPQ